MSYPTADALDLAADRIETVGWGQGGTKMLCMGVAIDLAVHNVCTSSAEGGWTYEAAVDARAALGRVIWPGEPAPSFRKVVLWNDTPGRTSVEVLDALRKAAKDERTATDTLCAVLAAKDRRANAAL